MKKVLWLVLFLFVLAPVMTSCGGDDPEENQNSQGDADSDGDTDADADADGDTDADADADADGDTDADGDGDGEIALTLTGISPDEGAQEGGTTVTLSGTGFEEGMEVFFGTKSATSVNRFGQLSAEAVTPASEEGVVSVRVVNPDGSEAELPQAFTFVEEVVVDPGDDPKVSYCQLQPQSTEAAPLMVEVNEEFSLYAFVYVEGVTEGEGPGLNIEAEMGIGTEWGSFEWYPMGYTGDVDGVNAGDLANDEYVLTDIVDEAGEYNYIARFRAEGDDSWVNCGAGGPILTVPEASNFGHLTVEEASNEPPQPESCGIQFPLLAQDLVVGDEVTLYGRVYEPGLTNQATLPAGLVGEVWVGPLGEDPVANPSAFEVSQAVRNPEYVDEDFEEFEATITVDASGTWAYVYRFSINGGTDWSYCDIAGKRTEAEVDPERFGALAVWETAPELVDYCRTFNGSVFADPSGDGPEVRMELYHGGVTDQGAGDVSGSFEVEVGFGPVDTNPLLAFGWRGLPFSEVSTFAPNNLDYEGLVFEAADNPGLGEYHVITRARLVGEDGWNYCNIDPDSPNLAGGLMTWMFIE